MRLKALLACLIAVHLSASGAEPSPRPLASVANLRLRGDALRSQGDYQGALDAYRGAMALAGENADLWKHIGWTQKAMRNYADAAASLEKATLLDPNDREAQDDLRDLKQSRGLRLEAWLGGTEPGTSKNAFEAQLSYAGLNRVQLYAGGSWTDNIFYEAVKGYGGAYWFYSPDSYFKADLTLRRYGYTGANRPTPDSNAYNSVPRADLEMSHWFESVVRGALDYQAFAPNFFYDSSTRILNHKLSAEIELPIARGLSLGMMAAILRDPDPAATTIAGRPLPGSAPGTICPGAGPASCATATSVVFRSEVLVGGSASYEAERWGAAVKYVPNRDLDSGFAWSVISSLDLRPLEKLSFKLQWVFDRYSASSGPVFAGKNGHIWWATARYQLTRALALGGGVKWVSNPSPSDLTGTSSRNDPTLLLNLEYGTVLF